MLAPLPLSKKMPWYVTYPTLIVFSLSLFYTGMYFYFPKIVAAQGWNVPFEGRITYIEWNCLCNLGIMITVTPVYTQATANNRGPVTLMFYYAGALLDALGIEITIPGTDIKLPYPMIYAWWQVYEGSPEVLGNYIPGSFQCWAYAGTGCSVNGNATGAIIGMGTALY